MFYKIAYAMIDYHRIEDNQALQINSVASDAALVGEEYKIVSYNIGFAAYTPDFGFFMDGGKESRAKSEESVKNVTSGIAEFLNSESPDFMMIEEVDKNSTRSYHYDEEEALRNSLCGYNSMYAVNFDSPYLYYPLNKPHGKSYSGLLTLSKYDMQAEYDVGAYLRGLTNCCAKAVVLQQTCFINAQPFRRIFCCLLLPAFEF